MMIKKRFLALAGVFLLLLLYLSALVLAFINHPAALNLLSAALFCTIVLPGIIYGYQMVLKKLKSPSDK